MLLRAQGNLNANTIGRSLRPDHFLRPDEDPDAVHIDLSAATFVDPAGLVTIGALVERGIRQGRQVIFTPPADSSVGNYLSRIGVKHFLTSQFIEPGLPTVVAIPHIEDLLELRPFASEFDGEQLAQLIFGKIAGDTDPGVPAAIYSSICELAANTTTHAEVPHGFAAAQTFGQGRNSRIVFAVADGGIGIQQSLSRHYTVETAEDALRLAVEYGTSGTGEQGRGSGLHDVKDDVAQAGGDFTIISGNAKLEASANRINITATASAYPGTLISGELSCR